ncbi:MAG TPA: right-handed parallel beta-helix repeat-containing protein [Malonomonas sp.]
MIARIFNVYPLAAACFLICCLCLVSPGFAETLDSGIRFEIVDGIRVVENQLISQTLTIDGQAWNHAIIRNNRFLGQSKTALHISNASNLLIEGNEFSAIGSFAIKLRDEKNDGAHDVQIRNNFFHDLVQTPIMVGEPNRGVQIIANRFVNVALNRSGNKQHAIYLKGPGYLVEGNLIDGVVDGNGVSIRTAGIVRNNIVRNVNRDGIKYYSSSSQKGSGKLVVEGNLVTDCGHGGIVFANGKGVLIDSAVVRFNTLINNQLAVRIYEGLEPIVFNLYANLLIESRGEYSSAKSTIDLHSENLTASGDIGFYDYSTGDYRIRPGSVAQDYVHMATELPPYDLQGRAYSAGPWTVGAYQAD